MSYDVTGMQSYIEQNPNAPAVKALTQGKTMKMLLSNRSLQLLEGKGKDTVNTMTNSVTFSDGKSCARVEDTATVLSQRVIEYVPLKINKKYCHSELYSTVFATALSKGQYGQTLDSSVWEAIVDDIGNLITSELEKTMWRGDITVSSGNLKWFDGYLTLAIAAGTTLTLTGSDIIAKLQSLASQVPITLRSQDDFRVFIGEDTKAALDLALYNKNMFNPGSMDVIPGTTVKLEVVPGLNGTSNKAVAMRLSNMRAIIDEVGEETKAQYFFDPKTRETFLDFYFGLGVQIVFPSETYYASIG
ncbi:MAG: hypothetical protein QM737_02735 [Ferruginibacter sp.]